MGILKLICLITRQSEIIKLAVLSNSSSRIGKKVALEAIDLGFKEIA